MKSGEKLQAEICLKVLDLQNSIVTMVVAETRVHTGRWPQNSNGDRILNE